MPPSHAIRAPLLSVPLILLAASATRARCANTWLPAPTEVAFAGIVGEVFTTTSWDPDGLGPAPLVVVGGSFYGAGAIAANNIAAFDPTTATWSTFAACFNGPERALATLPNGDLILGAGLGGPPLPHVDASFLARRADAVESGIRSRGRNVARDGGGRPKRELVVRRALGSLLKN